MQAEADKARVRIVTGDTKVVERGAADQVFVTTSGVGVIPPGRDLEAAGVEIEIIETDLPLRKEVKGMCEVLGLDPLYLANEGTLVLFVPEDEADAALAAMRSTPEGQDARVIGRALQGAPGRVAMSTLFGGKRLVGTLVGEQLPRIC